MHNNKIPPINKLSGFKSVKDKMLPHYRMLYHLGVLNNDRIKQAEFIIAYTKEIFWVMQSFLSNFINSTDMMVTSKYNANKIKIQNMDNPFEQPDAIRIEIIVNSSEKIKKAFEKLTNLKQLQFIQI